MHAVLHTKLYDVCGVIEAAGDKDGLFGRFIQEPLSRLSGQFDLKYWPSLSEFLKEIASDAGNAELRALDPVTAAATESSRPSRADCFRALFAAIDEISNPAYSFLPEGFRLTDNALATLANCALDLEPEQMVDGPYVKNERHRSKPPIMSNS